MTEMVEVPDSLATLVREAAEESSVDEWILDAAEHRLQETWRYSDTTTVTCHADVPDELLERAKHYADYTDQDLETVLINRFATFDYEFTDD